MTTISVMYPYFPDEFGFATREDLVASLGEELHGFDVELILPPGAGRGPDYWIELARWLIVYVPWDSLEDAAAQVLLTSLGGWLANQVRQRKKRDEATRDRLRDRNEDLFPPGASREVKETLLRETHYRIAIYPEKSDGEGPLAVIEVDEATEEVKITRDPEL